MTDLVILAPIAAWVLFALHERRRLRIRAAARRQREADRAHRRIERERAAWLREMRRI